VRGDLIMSWWSLPVSLSVHLSLILLYGHDDMVQAIKEVARLNVELTGEERNLFAIA